MEFLKSVVSSISRLATSPTSFLAYLVIVFVWVVIAIRVKRYKRILDNLEVLPSQDRLSLLQAEMKINVLKDGITPDQFVLSKIRLHYFLGTLLLTLALVLLLAVSITQRASPRNNSESLAFLTVANGSSGEAFNNSVIIRVRKIEFYENTSSYKVLVTIESPGFSSTNMDGAQAGSKSALGRKYEIEIIEVAANFAKFRVEQKEN
jgi:hypothetical protein